MTPIDWSSRDVRHAHACFPWAKALCWLIVIAMATRALWAVVHNPNFQWDVVVHYLGEPSILRGLVTTLSLTVVSMAMGSVIGLMLAMARLSDNALARGVSGLYIGLFRGTPLLVQLIFWYNLSTLFPTLGYTLPWESGGHWWNTNDLVTPLTAAIAGLALNEAAYMAEIIRAGLSSVDPKQMETAQAFGMSRSRALRRIVAPQAMRAIIPPAGNQLISMIKATSLVSVIAMSDLLHAAQTIYNRTFEVVPLLIVAVLWYLLITSVLVLGQRVLERRFSRGYGDMGVKARLGRARSVRLPYAGAGRDNRGPRARGTAMCDAMVKFARQAHRGAPLVTIRDVHKRFADQAVLKGLDIEVARGETVVLLGPSGAGKSTLLRCINHLETIDRGVIMVGEEQIGFSFQAKRLRKLSPRGLSKQRRNIGMVFQSFNLFPHMTVLQNLTEAPIGVHGESRAGARAHARALLAQVGLSEKAHAYPRQLSGGEQQRVAIARALAIRPALLLLDEPTSALDPERVGEVLSTMRSLAAQGQTMIVVTHEIGFAREAADRVVFIDEGRVIEQGTPEKVLGAPQHRRTQAFLRCVIHGQ